MIMVLIVFINSNVISIYYWCGIISNVISIY